MALVRGLAASLLGLLATVLGLVGVVLCITLVLLPLGLPVLGLSGRLFKKAAQLSAPRAVAHPLRGNKRGRGSPG